MHGSCHDFVVVKTVKDGGAYTTGHGGEALASQFVGGTKSIDYQPTFEKVLDIGSLDICGNQRDYNFNGRGPKWVDLVGVKEYVGIDIMAGRNVDIIMDAHDLLFKDNLFDLVMCMSMLEHDSNPQQTISEAYRVLKPKQPFIMTTVSEDHPEHKHLGGGDTETYNFFNEEGIHKLFIKAGFRDKDITIVTPATDIFVYAIK